MYLNTPSMCGTKITTEIALSGNMIPPLKDTDFRDNLEDVNELIRLAPEIAIKIDRDPDAYARKKKRSQQEDRKTFESRTTGLPELNTTERELATNELSLAIGQPRMTAYAVSSASWEIIMYIQIDFALNKRER